MLFNRIVILSLAVCLAGCSGKESVNSVGKAGQPTSLNGELVRTVSQTFPAATTDLGEQSQETLVHAAPDKCLLYSVWSGVSVEEVGNPADKLMMNPEFSEHFVKFASGLSLIPFGFAGEKQVESSKPVGDFVLLESLKQSPDMMKLLCSSPGCAFLDFSLPQRFGPPEIDAALVFQLGDRANSLYQHFKNGAVPFGGPGNVVEIKGSSFTKMEVEFEGMPLEIVFGASEGHFVVGLGEKSVDDTLSRMAAGKNPVWFAGSKLAAKPWPDLTEYFRVNVEGFLRLGGGLPPELNAFRDITEVEMLTGRTQNGVLHRFSINGGQVALGADGMLPVDFSKFDYIPEDALFAMVYGVHPEKAYRGFLRQIELADPFAFREFNQLEEGLKNELGINLRTDILDNLGSNLSLHAALNDDLLGGMVASVDIKDQESLKNVLDKLMAIARKQVGAGDYYGPTFRLWKSGEHDIVSMMDREFVVEPCLCIAKDRLIVSLSPEALNNFLAPSTVAPLFNEGNKKLFNRVVGEQAAPNDKLAFAGYVDMQTIAQVVYPIFRAAVSSMKAEASRMSDVDPVSQSFQAMVMNAELPPLRTMIEDLGPATMTIRFSDNGVDYDFAHTLPVLNPVGVLAAGFTCALPAMNAGRETSVRKANDLRQIGLACLNYESAFQRMPTDSVDADGNPLLSWRVQILPYIGQGNLAAQFRMDEPWDSKHNKQFLKQMPDLFLSNNPDIESGMTTLRGSGGEKGIFMASGKGAQLGDITDGSSNTILAVDAAAEFAVEWTKPGALDAETVDIEKLFGNRSKMLTQFVDGSMRRLPRTMDHGKVRMLFTRSDGNYVDIRDEIEASDAPQTELANALIKALADTNEKIYGSVELISRTPRRGGAVRRIGGARRAVDQAKDAGAIPEKDVFGSDNR